MLKQFTTGLISDAGQTHGLVHFIQVVHDVGRYWMTCPRFIERAETRPSLASLPLKKALVSSRAHQWGRGMLVYGGAAPGVVAHAIVEVAPLPQPLVGMPAGNGVMELKPAVLSEVSAALAFWAGWIGPDKPDQCGLGWHRPWRPN